MKIVRRLCGLSLLLALSALGVWAQPRPVATTPAKPAATPQKDDQQTAKPVPAPAPAPTNIKAKYEGGVFGYTKKQDGTLSFDEVNSRLIFRTKEGKELLSFPYSNLQMVYPDTKAVQPKAATIASNVPLIYAVPARFIKTKVRYLTFQFSDPNGTGGVTSFKLENKEILSSMVVTLCAKAELKTQGDSCYRPRSTASNTSRP